MKSSSPLAACHRHTGRSRHPNGRPGPGAGPASRRPAPRPARWRGWRRRVRRDRGGRGRLAADRPSDLGEGPADGTLIERGQSRIGAGRRSELGGHAIEGEHAIRRITGWSGDPVLGIASVDPVPGPRGDGPFNGHGVRSRGRDRGAARGSRSARSIPRDGRSVRPGRSRASARRVMSRFPRASATNRRPLRVAGLASAGGLPIHGPLRPGWEEAETVAPVQPPQPTDSCRRNRSRAVPEPAATAEASRSR